MTSQLTQDRTLSSVSVMERYFREHMAERDLLFLDDVAVYLRAFVPSCETPEPQQRDFIAHLYRTLNAPASKIRKPPSASPSTTSPRWKPSVSSKEKHE